MNIAIVVRNLPPDVIGGTQTQTKRMAMQLHERGHEVTIYTRKYNKDTEFDVEYDVCTVAHFHRSPFLSDLFFLVFCFIVLLKNSRKHDVLQCMMIYPFGFLGYAINKVTGIPYLAWIRGGDYYLMKDVWWKRWMMRRVLADTLVLAQSEKIRREVLEDFSDLDTTIEVLGNGVSIPEQTADGDDILYLGRLAPKKGVEYLLRAMAKIDADAELVLVGDGERREDLETIAAELNIAVRFEGFVEPGDVNEYYSRACLYVQPSVEGEGLPNSVLEAMSWGLPVISTDSGGLPTVVRHGENGFVVPMRDPSALAEYIEYLLDNPDERDRMGRCARAFVIDNYSWDAILSQLTDYYRDIT